MHLLAKRVLLTFGWTLPVLLLSLALLAGGCDEDSGSTAGGPGDNDAPIRCNRDFDCPLNHHCNLVQGVCERDPCERDADCNASEICVNTQCLPRHPACDLPTDSGCWPCQTCPAGTCEGEPCIGEEPDTTDGDEDVAPDNDDETPPGDEDDTDTTDDTTDTDDTADPDPEPEGGDVAPSCQSHSDCPYSANGQKCNPNTQQCEWCEIPCAAGKSCNWDGTIWYCGTPCNPPCGAGQACQLESCVPLTCTAPCAPCYSCNATTGYVCRSDPESCADAGDYDRFDYETRSACLPSNAPCGPGTICCSGTCLMGYCM